jgi:hypothetical protein
VINYLDGKEEGNVNAAAVNADCIPYLVKSIDDRCSSHRRHRGWWGPVQKLACSPIPASSRGCEKCTRLLGVGSSIVLAEQEILALI